MKRKQLWSLAVGVVCATVFSCQHTSEVYAAATTTVVDSAHMEVPSLEISTLYILPTGDVQTLEIHNNSESAIDLKALQLVSGKDMVLNLSKPGYLLPDASVSYVGGAAAGSSDFFLLPQQNAKVLPDATLSLEQGGKALDTFTYQPPLTNGVVQDRWWTRESGGYHNVFQSDFTSHPVSSTIEVEHNGLYERPAGVVDGFRVVEIYAHPKQCAPNDPDPLCYPYIKLYIPENQPDADLFRVRTDTSSKKSTLANTFSIPEGQEGYVTLRFRDDDEAMSLNQSGYVWLEDYTGTLYGSMQAYDTSGDDNVKTAFAFDGELWQLTTDPQPNGPNHIALPVEVVKPCGAGQYRSPETGRCRTIEETINTLAACDEGYERNPTTNRCRKIVTTAVKTLEPCKEGQERNPVTNRCRSIASAVAELLPCDEGYERNPATNRCRKVLAAATTSPLAPSKLVEQAKGSDWNAWTWTLVAVGATGAIGYGVYEWRHELRGFGQKIAAKLAKK